MCAESGDVVFVFCVLAVCAIIIIGTMIIGIIVVINKEEKGDEESIIELAERLRDSETKRAHKGLTDEQPAEMETRILDQETQEIMDDTAGLDPETDMIGATEAEYEEPLKPLAKEPDDLPLAQLPNLRDLPVPQLPKLRSLPSQ
jgi:hypothetical protein